MAEKKQKSTFVQFIFFIIMSLVAFAAQMLIVTFGDNLLELCGVDGTTKFVAWIFGEYTMTTFIAFLVGNVVAKIISYILNRKKTFAATNNLAFSFTVYVIMCVVLIIAETLVGEPLAKAYQNAIPALGDEWPATLSMITYSIADFLIVFLMEKFVIMNNNICKSKKASKVDDNSKIVDAVEPVEASAEEDKVEDTVVDEPAEDAAVVEEPVIEETKEEEVAPVTEEAKEEETAPVVEEAKEEEVAPVIEETKEEEVAPVVEETKEEEVAPVAEEVKEEEAAPVAEEKKAKAAGKIDFDLGLDGYHFYILANNNQIMFESQGFASMDTCMKGLDTFKNALETGVASVYQDKNKNHRFIINKRYVGEGYKTRAQAMAAIDSVKNFTANGTIQEFTPAPEKVAAYEKAKKDMQKAPKDYDWDTALALPAKTLGKFTVSELKDRGFYFTLYANNGQPLYISRFYVSADSCSDAIITFKKAAHLGNFFIDSDKFGNYRYILKGGNGSIVYYGESYSTKDSATNSSESVKKFAASAKIIPFSPEDTEDDE